MNPNELGNRYFDNYIGINRYGYYCKQPFRREPTEDQNIFVNKLLDLEHMRGDYEEQGYTRQDFELDSIAMKECVKLYRNDDILIGFHYKSILIYDGTFYIKTDNFNDKNGWYFLI